MSDRPSASAGACVPDVGDWIFSLQGPPPAALPSLGSSPIVGTRLSLRVVWSRGTIPPAFRHLPRILLTSAGQLFSNNPTSRQKRCRPISTPRCFYRFALSNRHSFATDNTIPVSLQDRRRRIIAPVNSRSNESNSGPYLLSIPHAVHDYFPPAYVSPQWMITSSWPTRNPSSTKARHTRA